jgi:tetratricopeptide (TPR) repeat protein/HEAT repeat protein
VRGHRFLVGLLLGLMSLPEEALAQQPDDFDPGGRRTRPQPGGGRRRRGGDDDDGEKKPNTDKLIKRYTAALLKSPAEAFPLQKLLELYRKRDGNLDKLVADFEARAAEDNSEQFNARVALAGVYVAAGRKDDAEKILDACIADKPKSAVPRMMMARLAESQNDKAKARTHYEAALPHLKGAEEEQVVRSLMMITLDLEDYEAAGKYHQRLIKSADGSLFVKKELGMELYNRGLYEKSEVEFRKVCKEAAGDNRALAPCLRDLGKALAKQKKMDEALKELKRARQIAGTEAGIRREILELLAEVFREQGKLIELIAILEGEDGEDFHRSATLGTLYEETGQVDKALSTYRSALKIQSSDIDVRVKLVHLLQTAGQLDEAIKEYEALIKAAPSNPEFVFALAQTYIQRGERDKALKLVADLERRNSGDADILASVADFYEEIEEEDKAVKVLEKLAGLPASDPQYLADLGDRYYQAGDQKKALATWQRIRTAVSNKALAHATLGDIFLEHDMPDEGIEELREAVKLAPKQSRYKKQLAAALERTAGVVYGARYRYFEALKIWEDLLAEEPDNVLIAREARGHIVGLWAILQQLESKVAPLTAKLNGDPPDIESGRLLAEVQRRLQKLDEAEKTLRKVVKIAPGDEGSLTALERILVMKRDLDGAIKVLEKLVALNPKRAREFYQRMSQYASELYRDDDALLYATKAVELSPDDAEGHFGLAKMHRKRGETEKAMSELHAAINKNDRLFKAYFELADMLVSAGKVEEADMLFRHVVRAARDEEYVIQATRLSMQINLGKGTLESLERELLPVALGNPQKGVYRRLLVELYGAMTFPLVHAARLGTGEVAKQAQAKLAEIGARAVKPLLDALTDEKVAQQRIAIEVLAYVQNKGAGPALFNFATGQAERELRVRAMVACGALNDPELLPRFEKLLAPDASSGGGFAPGDAVAVAAAWGVARMKSPKAEGLLTTLLSSGSPEIRGLAAIGLGLSKNKKHADTLANLARSPEAGPLARAAAAHALGELAHEPTRALLLALSDSAELQVKSAALLALSRLPASQKTIPADVGSLLARSLFGDSPELRRTAMEAATVMSTSAYRRDGAELPVPNGAVVVAEVLRDLAPRGYTAEEQGDALKALEKTLAKAALAAVATSPEQAGIVAELTLNKLAPLIELPAGTEIGEAVAKQLAITSEAIAKVSVNGFVALSRHPSLEVRKRAVEFLAQRTEPEAHKALIDALDGADTDVCKAALASLGTTQSLETTTAVVKVLEKSDSWALRVHAAEALAEVGLDDASGRAAADKALEAAATSDGYALVREAAIRAVAKRGGGNAKAVLAKVASADAEPRLRELAKTLSQ